MVDTFYTNSELVLLSKTLGKQLNTHRILNTQIKWLIFFRYVQQTQKVHDMARRFVAQNQSPKDQKPPPRRALVDRDELERFERNTKAPSWYKLEDDRRLDYRQLTSYNTNRPRRHSDGPSSQKLDSPQEFTGKPDLSKSVPGDLHRDYLPDDKVFLSPESPEKASSTSDEVCIKTRRDCRVNDNFNNL